MSAQLFSIGVVQALLYFFWTCAELGAWFKNNMAGIGLGVGLNISASLGRVHFSLLNRGCGVFCFCGTLYVVLCSFL